MDFKKLFSQKTEWCLKSFNYCEIPTKDFMKCIPNILDSISLSKICDDRIVYIINRKVSFEPSGIFEMNVEFNVVKYFNDEIDIKDIDDVNWEEELINSKDFFSNGVMDDISLIVSFITNQSDFPTYTTPPIFIGEEELKALKEENSIEDE